MAQRQSKVFCGRGIVLQVDKDSDSRSAKENFNGRHQPETRTLN